MMFSSSASELRSRATSTQQLRRPWQTEKRREDLRSDHSVTFTACAAASPSGIVVFFYLLDSLLTERKDRSILFWKSLPISDTEVVLVESLTALVAGTHRRVLLVSAFTQLACSVVVWSCADLRRLLGELLMPWDAGRLAAGAGRLSWCWCLRWSSGTCRSRDTCCWCPSGRARTRSCGQCCHRRASCWSKAVDSFQALCRASSSARRFVGVVRGHAFDECTFTGKSRRGGPHVATSSSGRCLGRVRRTTRPGWAWSRPRLMVYVTSAFDGIATIPDTASRPGGFTHSAIFWPHGRCALRRRGGHEANLEGLSRRIPLVIDAGPGFVICKCCWCPARTMVS